jgi:zinc protease
MKHAWKLAAGLLPLVALAAAPQAAQDLPKAETILDKYIEVTGGKAAHEKIRTEIISGKMEFAANGISGTMTAWHAEPDKSLMEIDIPGLGKMREGFDGTVAWSLSALQGPHIKEGAEKEDAVRQARMNSDLHWRELYPKVETTGVESVDGKDCYKVVLTPASGNPITQYYDKQSNLLVRMTMTATTAMGNVPVDSVAADYHKDGEILSPHKLTQKLAGQQITLTVDKVEYNAEIPPGTFDLPDEIKALANKK